jgi:hypothetical protein
MSALQSEKGYNLVSVTDYFTRLQELMVRFEAIAQKELDNIPFSDADIAFLQDMVEEHETYESQGCMPSLTPVIVYTGWYDDLFFVSEDASKEDFIIADVHTQPSDEAGLPVGKVLHVGIGPLNLGVFIAPSPSNNFKPVAFVGPVLSYYEKTTQNFNRLTDQEWADSVNAGNVPPRPDWVYNYIADGNGNTQPGRELPFIRMHKSSTGITNTITKNDGELNVFPNPVNTRANFAFSAHAGDDVKIHIYDSYGKLIHQLKPYQVFEGNNVYTWMPPDGMNGVYHVKLIKESEEYSTSMVVISE